MGPKNFQGANKRNSDVLTAEKNDATGQLQADRTKRRKTFFDNPLPKAKEGGKGEFAGESNTSAAAHQSGQDGGGSICVESGVEELPHWKKAVDGTVYRDPVTKMQGKWHKGNNSLMCLATSVCGCGKRMGKGKKSCLAFGQLLQKAGEDDAPLAPAQKGGAPLAPTQKGGAPEPRRAPVITTPPVVASSQGWLKKLIAEAPKHFTSSRDGGKVVLINEGDWDDEMASIPCWVIVISGERVPLRLGASWIKHFMGGKHGEAAGVVGSFWLKFLIARNVSLSQPIFKVCLYDGAEFFGKKTIISGGSLSEVELNWMQQGGKNSAMRLADLHKTTAFAGLSGEGLCDHFMLITKGFGEKQALQTRDRGRRGEDLSARQLRRIGQEALRKVEEALNQVCPGQPVRAFEVLTSNPKFKQRFLKPLLQTSQAQSMDAMTANLVERYEQAQTMEEKRAILSIYSPFHTYADTISTFGVTQWRCKMANHHHQLKSGLNIKHIRSRVLRLDKRTVSAIETMALDPNFVKRVAWSSTKRPRLLRVMNRNRMYRWHVKDMERKGLRPLGKTAFYKYYSDKIYKDVTPTTCACAECVEGDEALDSMRELAEIVLSGPELLTMLNDIENLQYFLTHEYKRMLLKSSSELRLCLTYALSDPNGGAFSKKCDHTHVDTCEILWMEEALIARMGQIIESKRTWNADVLTRLEAVSDLASIADGIFRCDFFVI